MKIDFHCHAFPAECFQTLKKYYPDVVELKEDDQGRLYALWANTRLPAWDHGQRLRDIDRVGVDIEILSNPPIYSRVDDHSPELCRMVNDALAESCKRDPDRFKAFAHIPFNNMDAALKELARTLDELGFVGVLITSNVGGRYLHTPDFFPFWEEVNRRRVPVFMHPSHSPYYRDVGIDHIVYGTDYFIVGTKFMDWTNEFLEGLDLSPIEREKVYSQNAARILNL